MLTNYELVFKKPNCISLEASALQELQPDQVLIKSSITLISTGTELSLLSDKNKPQGSKWERVSIYPKRPGYSNVGTIIKTGKDVPSKLIGNRVVSACKHASYGITTVDKLRMVPEKIEDRHAVFFTIAVIVMNGVRRSKLKFGDSVAIYGAGLLGQLTARLCKICGAYPIIVVDTSDERLSRIPQENCYIKLNPVKDDVCRNVSDITRTRMCDVVFELTGNSAIIPDELNLLRSQGKFVILSSPMGKTLFDFHDFCNSPSYTIIGAHNSSHPVNATLDNPWTKERDTELFFDYLLAGFLNVEELISHAEPYTKAIELYNALLIDRTKALGVLLYW